jgi:hypothetical protein
MGARAIIDYLFFGVAFITSPVFVAGCDSFWSSPNWTVLAACTTEKIVVLIDDKVMREGTATDGSLVLIATVKALKPGSTAQLRVLGADEKEYKPEFARWNPGGMLADGPFPVRDFEVAEVRADLGSALIFDVAFFVPKGVLTDSMKLKTQSDGGIVFFKPGSRCR